MNAELVNLAMEKVGNAYVLVNLVSRRVRQLNAGGGANRPLVAHVEHLGPADIALREIVDGSMGWDIPEWVPVTRPVGKRRKKPESERPRARPVVARIGELVAD